MHFGMMFGLNKADFFVQPTGHFERRDSLRMITSGSGSGFVLGPIADFRLHKYLTLRFLPAYCFSERSLIFDFEGREKNYTLVKKMESAFLRFPVNLKLRSKRVGNFSAYIIAGAGYSRDLSSKRKVDNNGVNFKEQIVKLKRDDFFYEAGSGAEFYLKYIKLSLEVKFSMGLRNMLVKDNTIFSNAIDKLKSKIVLISLTFES